MKRSKRFMSVETIDTGVHTEHAVLDIGGDIGALIIYTRKILHGREIEVSPRGRDWMRTHSAVLERKIGKQSIFAALFLALPVGEYQIWGSDVEPIDDVTISGGQVAEVDWRTIKIVTIPIAGPSVNPGHNFGPYQPDSKMAELLPPRYQGKEVSAAPMQAAPLAYAEDGQVAWDEIWTGFCDLALAGGPPHRGELLEPVTADEIRGDEAGYEQVVQEIERGFRLVTALATRRSKSPGWVGLVCESEEMALWMLRAIIVENVSVRREGRVLYLPAGPAFHLEKEIKNVVTVVAKTHHYWKEHISYSR
jgi:hypothetical protein